MGGHVGAEAPRSFFRVRARHGLDAGRHFVHPQDVGGGSIGLGKREIGDLVACGEMPHEVPRAQLSAFVEREEEIGFQPEDAHGHAA